jgi:hypothetical protein
VPTNVRGHEAGCEIRADTYRLRIDPSRPYAELFDAEGRPLGRLALLADVSTADGLDGTTSVGRVERIADGPAGPRFGLAIASTRWAHKTVIVECRPDAVALRVEVEGTGRLADVRLLGGYAPGVGSLGSGTHHSQLNARTLVSPNPEDPHEIAVDARRPAAVGAVGGGGPGRGHWFFTPAPLAFALSASPVVVPAEVPRGPWATVGVAAPVAELTFTELRYEPADRGFSLRLAYEGQTAVDGSWASPWVLVSPGAADPYAGFAAYARRLVADGLAPEPSAAAGPDWWLEPIFCGWGAQAALAARNGGRAPDYATQATYHRLLAELDARGIDPGTIVVDDRWQRHYGTGEPDPARWPALPGWIVERHERGQRVLLWWKAWDADGIPSDECVRTADGRPITVDPSNPAYRARLTDAIRRLILPPPLGLGADGLKIDFTALTPSGPGLERHGTAWGIALLHELLATIHDAAKSAHPDALVVAHAPNPAFADVADAVRLNDVLRLEDPDRGVPVVAQMRHRAAIARAALPHHLVETDDWAMPNRAAWREYLEAKVGLGIPSLYYTTHVDVSGETLTDDDVATIRRTWAAYRRAAGLRDRGGIEEHAA